MKKKQKKTKAEEQYHIKANAWLEKKSLFFFVAISILCLIFSLLLFNARISEGGDDSSYIEAGYKYSKHFFSYYYTFNAPLYPMLLSIPIFLFGLKLMLLKSLSILFNYLHIVFLYLAFRKKIDNIILFPVLVIVSINSYFLYYASQTYTESFYLFLLALLFYFVSKLLTAIEQNKDKLAEVYTIWLCIGLSAFLVSLSKNLGLVIVPSMAIFFLIKRKYWHMLYSVASFLVFKIPFEIIKNVIWGDLSQYKSQGSVLLLKNAYQPSEGLETVSGYLGRLYDNSNLYLSKRLFQILGFRHDDSTTTSIALTILVAVLFLYGLYKAFKNKNNLVFFVALTTLFMMGFTFIAIQAFWDQTRLVLVFVPVLILVVFYGIYSTFQGRFAAFQKLYTGFVFLILLMTILPTIKKTAANLPILKKNLSGNIYYGYTTDWVNYLRISEWCGKNLPDTALVACRKSPMSFIYSEGKTFYPVYNSNPADPDSVLAEFKNNKVTHVIVANLRKHPTKADGQIINTVHKKIQPFSVKYPQKIRLIHTEGYYEQAYLYEIRP